MKTTKTKWDEWELIAIKYLQRNLYKIVDTNFRFSRFWEIDIVCENNSVTHFIEVKYRNNDKFWTPEEAITKWKLKKLKKTIEYYILKNRLSSEKIQFDVITITKWEKSYQLKHYKNLGIES